MEELASTENYIAFTRQAYNNTDIFYNDKVREQFPTVLFSGIFGFGLAEYWLTNEIKATVAPNFKF